MLKEMTCQTFIKFSVPNARFLWVFLVPNKKLLPQRIGEHEMKTKNTTVGFIAWCSDCDWRNEDYKTAQEMARSHARWCKHLVHCEKIQIFDYNEREIENDMANPQI